MATIPSKNSYTSPIVLNNRRHFGRSNLSQVIAPADKALTPSPEAPLSRQGANRLKGRIRLLLCGTPCGPPSRLFPVLHDRKKRPAKTPP